MGITNIYVFRDSKLVVQQVKNTYHTKHPRMKAYRNKLWDTIDKYFHAFNITIVPRDLNKKVGYLDVA